MEQSAFVKDASVLLVKILRNIPVVGLHSVQTAKISALIAKTMGMNPGKILRIYLLGALHDIGLMIPQIRKRFHEFDFDTGIVELIKHEDLIENHGSVGAKMVESISILEDYSISIAHHHTPAFELDIGECYMVANLINAANTISLKLLENGNLADENFLESLREYFNDHKSEFFPDIREAALEAARSEAYMMMAADGEHHWDDFVGVDFTMDSMSFVSFLTLMDYLVDSMCPETEHHSTRVAFLAREIAKEILTESEGTGVYIAGKMHDLGKIFLPLDVVSKRDDSDYEFRLHAIHTHNLLKDFRGFQSVIVWAATHHERLDGSGYPWHLTSSSLSKPARILQIADEYVSLMEKGAEDPIGELKKLVREGKYDGEAFEVLEKLLKNGYDVMEYYDVIAMYVKEVGIDEGSEDSN